VNYRKSTILSVGLLTLILLALSTLNTGEAAAPQPDLVLTPYAYLPFVAKPSICPPWSANEYASGTAHQYDRDDPVRPAYDHADKNIELRGYTANTDPGLERDLIDYGSDDPKQPPQFATLFDPPRVPTLAGFYQVHHWDWAASPDPGRRLGPILSPPVTALGLQTTPGEALHVPASGYDIGGGMEVLVLFADHDTVALRYTREDSSAPPGYTIHIDNICTDPNLLALYNTLDDPSGPRYQYPNASYGLPNLYAGQSFGVARTSEVVVAIADTGSFQDPRSLDEWWQIRPGYSRYPADVYYTNQWALERVRAPQAWAHSTGRDIVVAVLDTGVDLDHPDLMSKVLTDLDRDFVNDDFTAADDHGHGTHVAGIAAAATDNGLGIAGLGWDVRILPLKVLDSEGNGDGLNLAAAIRYAADRGADVINMSLGGAVPCGWPVDDAVNDAHSRGVTLIAAAGNYLGDTEMFPANCEHVLGVAATDHADAVAYYSNYGNHVSVAAPGSGIYSTLNGGSYGYDSGTSMATPHVAGLAALLAARYPPYTPDLVASAILDTAQDLGASGWDQHYGCGRIDASLALSTGALNAEPICLQAVGPWAEASPKNLEEAPYVPGEIIVDLRPGVRAFSISGRHGVGVEFLFGLGVWRLSVPQGQERSVLAELESDPDVVRAGLNYLVSAQ
jgi:hypothetical protein